MRDTTEVQVPELRTAPDVDTWHPDLEILVRYNVPFICFDRSASPVHVSPGANALLARTQRLNAMLPALRDAALDAFVASEQPSATPAPRVTCRVNDPSDGSSWDIHVVRTRHDWSIAIAVRDNAGVALPESRQRARLTQRELEVAALVAEGARSKGVAEALDISVHTVRRHTEVVFRKFGVHSRAELTRAVLGAHPTLQHAGGA